MRETEKRTVGGSEGRTAVNGEGQQDGKGESERRQREERQEGVRGAGRRGREGRKHLIMTSAVAMAAEGSRLDFHR